MRKQLSASSAPALSSTDADYYKMFVVQLQTRRSKCAQLAICQFLSNVLRPKLYLKIYTTSGLSYVYYAALCLPLILYLFYLSPAFSPPPLSYMHITFVIGAKMCLPHHFILVCKALFLLRNKGERSSTEDALSLIADKHSKVFFFFFFRRGC